MKTKNFFGRFFLFTGYLHAQTNPQRYLRMDKVCSAEILSTDSVYQVTIKQNQTHVFNVEVNDGNITRTDKITISVKNNPGLNPLVYSPFFKESTKLEADPTRTF